MRIGAFSLIFSLLALTAGPASAASIFATAANSTGTQTHGGPLGLDFTVGSQNITITRLGVFDDLADGLNTTITGYIYDFNSQTLVPGLGPIAFTTANSTLEPGTPYRFIDIPDVTLSAGVKYTVVADGYNGSERNGNANTGGPGITFPNPGVTYNGDRYAFPPGTYPVNVDSGYYAAGNFEFSVVPEPASCTLLGLGLLSLVAIRRRGRNA